jgi:5-methylcytosine-specific restriction protein B
MAINKIEIYKQIDAFNNTSAVAGGRAIKADEFHYVVKEIAEDRAAFLKFILSIDEILKSKNIKNVSVLDLTFGSGNLTSHLILDNNIDFSKIIFNDKNSEHVNSKIVDLYEKKAVIRTGDF